MEGLEVHAAVRVAAAAAVGGRGDGGRGGPVAHCVHDAVHEEVGVL